MREEWVSQREGEREKWMERGREGEYLPQPIKPAALETVPNQQLAPV